MSRLTRKNSAVGALDAGAQFALTADSIPSPSRRPLQPQRTVISQFQAGHGWTNGGGTFVANNTANPVIGSQYASITTLGGGVGVSVSSPAFTAQNLANRNMSILMRVSDVTKLNNLRFIFATSTGITNFEFIQPVNQALALTGNQLYQSGVWTWLHLSWADVAASGGTPDRTAIAAVQVVVKDDGTGPVTVDFAEVSHFAKSPAFPNGVVSLRFDDNFTNGSAFSLVDAQGWKASLFLILDRLDQAGYLTTEQIINRVKIRGWDAGAHASTAANHQLGFTNLAPADLQTELQTVKKWLLQNVPGNTDLFAYPKGLTNVAVEKAVQRYFSLAIGTNNLPRPPIPIATPMEMQALGVSATTTPAVLLAEMQKAYTNGTWLVLTIHNVVASGTETDTQMLQSNFASLVSNLVATGIPVKSVGEVMQAIAA